MSEELEPQIGGYFAIQTCIECGRPFGVTLDRPYSGGDEVIIWEFCCDDCTEYLNEDVASEDVANDHSQE